MKIVALLAWYEERPSWLAATVASLAGVADHLVAVDGAYLLFPGGRERTCSGAEQAETVLQTAHGCGLSCTVHVPREPFYGNEVEKRSLMFRLAEPLVELGRDWYLIVDSDEVVQHAAPDLRARLAGGGLDVAEYELFWRDDRHATALDETHVHPAARVSTAGRTPVRGLMRALPKLRCERAHYVYVAEKDGRDVYLWGNRDFHPLEDALDVTSLLKIEHRHAFRNRERQLQAKAYYERRDTHQVEALAELHWESVDGEPVKVAR